MRIVIAGSGSQGDTRPYLALAAGLNARGHETAVCLDRSGADIATRLGVEFHELAGDFRRHLDGGAGQRALERNDGGLTGLRLFADVGRTHTRDWIETIAQVARQHRADVVVGSGLATWAAITAAELTGAQAVGAAAFPLTPTDEFPSPVSPARPPARLNRLTHHVGIQAVWSVFRRPTNRVRREMGLGSLRVDWGTLPVLYGFSEHLVPRPADWPAAAAVCGEWQLSEPDWVAPDELAAVLQGAEPPVYIGFGSMSASGTAGLISTLLAALDRPVLLAPGWSGVVRELGTLPDSVHLLGQVPHARVLPFCAFAVHHCGAGTTHAVARAGIPSVPVPFAADQPFWARRLADLGIGSEPLDRRRATLADARRAIAVADSPVTRARAAEIAARMDEDSVGAAIAHLEHVLA